MTLYYDDNAGTTQFNLQDFEPSFGRGLRAVISNSWDTGYWGTARDTQRLKDAASTGPKLSAADAKARIDATGLRVGLAPKDNEYTAAQLDVILERQREITRTEDIMERTPWSLVGTPIRGAAMFATGMADPLNLATAFVPWPRVFGGLKTLEAATMASSAVVRAAGRGGIGAIDAGVSTAALEPFYADARKSLGDDYDAVDSVANIALGTAFGGGIHTMKGVGVDAFRWATGRTQPYERFAGLSVDQIAQVQGLEREIKAGMDARDVQRVLETYTPEMRRAAGYPDPEPVAPVTDAAPANVAPSDAAPSDAITAPARTADAIAESAPARRTDLMAYLRDSGGVDPTLARNAGGDKGNYINRQLPGTVRKGGIREFDQLAERMAEDGWLPAGVDPASPEGEAMAADLLERALSGDRILRADDMIREAELRAAQAFDEADRDRFEAEIEARLERETIQAENDLPPASEILDYVDPGTREMALATGVGQALSGRSIDVDAIVRMDDAVGATATQADVAAAAARNQRPEAVRTADFDASAAVDERNAAAPKWDALADAEAALADADTLLRDTVKAGDQAFKYSRGEAPGQKKATLWQGTTARFAPEDGAPLGRFRWDMINSIHGEGFQAFGYGHYLAQQAWISQTRYRERLIGIRKTSLDSFAIPDGDGGVITINRRDNEAAWQLPDGTILHESQKNPAMAAKAAAISQVQMYGYARARETFENLYRGNKEFVDNKLKQKDEWIAELRADLKRVPDDEKASVQKLIDQALNSRDDLLIEVEKDAARLAALDEVTVDAPREFIETKSGEEWLTKDDSAAIVREFEDSPFELWVNKAPAGKFDTLEAAQKAAGTSRTLAPGIKKYEPPAPDNLRERVVAGDGTELTGQLAEFILKQADKKRGVSQTLGRELKRGPTQIEGANVKVAPIDLIDGTKFDAELQALHDRGITELTIERPGSLYRAEMDVEAFQSLMLWNAPMAEQPAKVREVFKRWGIEADPIRWGGDLDGDGNVFAINKRLSILKSAEGWVISDGHKKVSDKFYADRGEAMNAAERLVDIVGSEAYARLQEKIESGDTNEALDDAIMAAHHEIARRRFGRMADEFTDPYEAMTDAGYEPQPDEVASVILHNAGIPGHAFLDGDAKRTLTWADADATFNIVIYSDDVAKIVDRYARQTGEIQRATDTPEGLTEALRLSFGRDTDALIKTGRVQIVATPKDIPGGPHPGDVKAATAPDGTVYVVAENVSEAEARGIMLHEVGVHVGMRDMLGDDVFGAVLSELDDAIMRGEDWAQAARAAVPADTLPAHVREEQLAYLVQNAPELPIVQRIIAAVRAWAYRTFSAARERMTLTEADFRAMAVAALHHAARNEGAATSLVPAYSRGPTQDPSTADQILKRYDEAVERAKSYSGVLRAAADKLDNDAHAVAAMRAALPDITEQEIGELLSGLRKQVTGLRGAVQRARSAFNAEDTAAALQSDAMKAADLLANNLEMAAVIERRNAALNLNVRLKSTTFVNQFRDKGLDFEGFAALLVGSERVRTGSRVSVDAEYKGFRGEWVGGMLADLEKANLTREFISGAFDRDVYDALWRMGGESPDMTGLAPQAVKLAEIVNKYQQDARNTRNRFGAWIRDLKGYITRQSHDMFKIRSVKDAEWIAFVLERIDLQKMIRLGLISETDPIASLRGMYDDFAAGVHMKTPAGEDDMAAFGVGANLAKRESVSRTIYFKDGVSAYEYNERFGQGRLSDSVLGGLEHAARSTALLKTLGTNPEATLTRMLDEYEASLSGEPERRSKFRTQRGTIMNMLAQVDGSVNVPGNLTAAKVGTFLRSWQAMAKLGGALISSVTDLAGYAAELRYQGNKNLFTGVLDGIGRLTQGRAKGEQAQVLSSLGVFHESTVGAIMSRFDNPDLMGGKTAWAMQQFFRLNGLTWWTETLRDGAALSHSHYMAQNAGKTLDAVDPELRRLLQLYNIDAGKWDILRAGSMKMADGRAYMTPEGLRTVPRSALEAYIASVGRTVSDASVQNLLDDLSQALRLMAVDRAHHAVLEPGARTRAFMLRGSQPGTVSGELLRYIGQFKSFSVAMIQMVLGREIYGRGYDTVGEYLRKGHGDMLGLATFIGLLTAFGYGAMAIKDMLKGREPRDPKDQKTWMAALVQGGGLGLYGDFLFGEYSRMGRTFTASLAGPVLGNLDILTDLFTRLRNGDDTAATAFNAMLANTPGLNLYYVRPLLDYLILYQIQEAMNPGFLRRMEGRIKRQNGQEFMFRPSQYALGV